MTAFGTKADLKAYLVKELARTDMAANWDELIMLAETDIRADLRKEVVIAALTMDMNPEALPAACEELKAIRYNTASYVHSLDGLSMASLAAVRQPGTGRPSYFAVANNSLYFDITPDSAYTMEITYYSTLVALGADGTTNTTLTNSPNIYLYATLLHSAPFLEHDDRAPMWRDFYDQAVAKENLRRERSELGSAPMSIGLPTVF